MSSEHNVNVVRIGDIEKHPDADTLGRVIMKLHGEGYLTRKGG